MNEVADPERVYAIAAELAEHWRELLDRLAQKG